MIPILANAMVEVNQGDQHIVIDPPIAMGALYLFILVLPMLFILGLIYFKLKFRHQQILAAIERGQPITDLIASKPSEISWIRNLAAGVGLIFIGLAILIGLIVSGYFGQNTRGDEILGALLFPAGFSGIGLIFLLRGILQRNREWADKHIQK
jgi:hypothetical protein